MANNKVQKPTPQDSPSQEIGLTPPYKAPETWVPITTCRFHSAVQLEYGLGSKSRISVGEQGCTLFACKETHAIKVVKGNAVQIVPNAMVYTLATT